MWVKALRPAALCRALPGPKRISAPTSRRRSSPSAPGGRSMPATTDLAAVDDHDPMGRISTEPSPISSSSARRALIIDSAVVSATLGSQRRCAGKEQLVTAEENDAFSALIESTRRPHARCRDQRRRSSAADFERVASRIMAARSSPGGLARKIAPPPAAQMGIFISTRRGDGDDGRNGRQGGASTVTDLAFAAGRLQRRCPSACFRCAVGTPRARAVLLPVLFVMSRVDDLELIRLCALRRFARTATAHPQARNRWPYLRFNADVAENPSPISFPQSLNDGAGNRCCRRWRKAYTTPRPRSPPRRERRRGTIEERRCALSMADAIAWNAKAAVAQRTSTCALRSPLWAELVMASVRCFARMPTPRAQFSATPPSSPAGSLDLDLQMFSDAYFSGFILRLESRRRGYLPCRARAALGASARQLCRAAR